MLTKFESEDGTTLTVYSNKIAVGGITFSNQGAWYWAIFAVRSSHLDAVPQIGSDLGGVEWDRERAFGALSRRWSRWVSDAGLTYAEATRH